MQMIDTTGTGAGQNQDAAGSGLSEQMVREIVGQSALKLESGYKAEIQANNEHLEERIDDILVQI